MAKLKGVKTIDMIGGEITKVEYDGAVYGKTEDKAVPPDIVEIIDGFGHLVSGDFGEVVYDGEGDITVYDGVGHRVIYRGIPDAVNVFRKISESSTPTIEQVDAKVDDLTERVTKLEGEKKYEPTSGDVVVITGNTNHSRNEIGDIGKVGRVRLGSAEVDVIGKTEGNGNWTKFSEMRPATDEEKAEYERAAKFAKLGRKPGEFKKGDIVRLIQSSGADSEGTVVEIASDKARTYIGVDGDTYLSESKWFELIAQVESRVDIDE